MPEWRETGEGEEPPPEETEPPPEELAKEEEGTEVPRDVEPPPEEETEPPPEDHNREEGSGEFGDEEVDEFFEEYEGGEPTEGDEDVDEFFEELEKGGTGEEQENTEQQETEKDEGVDEFFEELEKEEDREVDEFFEELEGGGELEEQERDDFEQRDADEATDESVDEFFEELERGEGLENDEDVDEFEELEKGEGAEEEDSEVDEFFEELERGGEEDSDIDEFFEELEDDEGVDEFFEELDRGGGISESEEGEYGQADEFLGSDEQKDGEETLEDAGNRGAEGNHKQEPPEGEKSIEGDAQPPTEHSEEGGKVEGEGNLKSQQGSEGGQGLKEGENSGDFSFTASREWGGRKTPDGGWAQYFAETSLAQDGRTGATSERTDMIAWGETGGGDRVRGMGRAEGVEFPARLQNGEGWFEEIYIKAGRSSAAENWETDRSVDASLMRFPPGADVREGLRVTDDPDLRNLRAFGRLKEFWTDDEGFPTVRDTRWLIFQKDSDEGKGEGGRFGEGDPEGRRSLFIFARTDMFQFRPGAEGKIGGKSSYTTFFPLEGGEGQDAKGGGPPAGSGGGEGAKSLQQGIGVLFGGQGDGGPRNEYRCEGEFTHIVYLPPGTETGEKTSSTGDKAQETGLVERADGSDSQRAEQEIFESVGETSNAGTAGESGAGETSEDTTPEKGAPEGAVEGDGENLDTGETGESSEGETEERKGDVDEGFEDAVEGGDEVSEFSETVERTSGEAGEGAFFVEVGGGERVSLKDVLRVVGEGVYRWGEEDYYRKLRELGVEVDRERLSRMLFVERRVSREVYLALKALKGERVKEVEGGGEGKIPGVEVGRGAGEEAASLGEGGEGRRVGVAELQQQAGVQGSGEGNSNIRDLLFVVRNLLRGISYSLSREQFLKILGEAVRRVGGEEKFLEFLRRRRVARSEVGRLFEVLQGGGVSLQLFGEFLKLAEETQGVWGRVQELVEKTLELFKRLGVDLKQDNVAIRPEDEAGEEGDSGELRGRGYAYLGEVIGRYLEGEGLLDDWIFDLIMMCWRQSSTDTGKDREVLEGRLREMWESLGVGEFRLSLLVEEVYERLGRDELLIFLYNGRVDPLGRRGRVTSFVDVLEILVEAARKIGGEEKFLELVRGRTGKLFSPHLLDEMLATRHLDEEIFQVALECVYETGENIGERLKLLEGNTKYILTRLMEETSFLSKLERVLEPLAELNSRLERLGRVAPKKEYEKELALRGRVELGEMETRVDIPHTSITEPRETGTANVNTANLDKEKEMFLYGTETAKASSESAHITVEDSTTFGRVGRIPSPYIDTNVSWNAILNDKDTRFILEYLRPLWRKQRPFVAPEGPIIDVRIKNGYGFESNQFLFNIISTMIDTFRPRTSASKDFPSFTRYGLSYFIGKYYRDLARIIDLYPDFPVDDTLSVYIFDHRIAFVDLTTSLIYSLDDKEQPAGLQDFGVTSQLSLVRYGDRDGGLLNQTFIIQNDPLTCLMRRLLLMQRDSNKQPIYSEERLTRLGLGYINQDREFVSCIGADGAITKLVLWDMGVNPYTLNPIKVIDLSQIGADTTFEKQFDTGKYDWRKYKFKKTGTAIVWCRRTETGDKYVLNILRENVDYLIPEKLRPKDPARCWWDINTERLYGILNTLMNVFGVKPLKQSAVKAAIEKMRGKGKSLEIIKYIGQSLSGRGISLPNVSEACKPFSFNVVKNIFSQTFVEQSFDAYLNYGRRIKEIDGSDELIGSDRYAFEMCLGSGIAMVDITGNNYRDNTVYFSIGADPTTLALEIHPGYGFIRGDTPLYKISASEFKSHLPSSVEPDNNGHILCGIDIAGSEERGMPIVFVPIFKEGSKISHKKNPDDFIIRISENKSSVPIISKMSDFWSSIDKYAVFTVDKEGMFKPLNKSTDNSNIYSESEFIPTSFLEILHMLTILENLSDIAFTHSEYSESETSSSILSPKYFFKELKGHVIDKPKEALKIFKSFRGDKILAELRKIKPLIPYTNASYAGWFMQKGQVQEVMKGKIYPKLKKDIVSLNRWKTLRPCPTQVNLFIILLSYTGAQRAIGSINVILPINIEKLNPKHVKNQNIKYRIGSARFNTQFKEDLKLLDKVGVPVDKYGRTFKVGAWRAEKPDKKFSELSYDEILLVRGLKTHTTLNPSNVREVFYGRVPGVPAFNPDLPREEQNLKLFDNLLIWEDIYIPQTKVRYDNELPGGYHTGYYSWVEWLMLEKMRFGEIFEIAYRQGEEKLRYIKNLIRDLSKERDKYILQLGKSLNNKHYTRIDDSFTLWFQNKARISPSEKFCINWHGRLQLENILLHNQIHNILTIINGKNNYGCYRHRYRDGFRCE